MKIHITCGGLYRQSIGEGLIKQKAYCCLFLVNLTDNPPEKEASIYVESYIRKLYENEIIERILGEGECFHENVLSSLFKEINDTMGDDLIEIAIFDKIEDKIYCKSNN